MVTLSNGLICFSVTSLKSRAIVVSTGSLFQPQSCVRRYSDQTPQTLCHGGGATNDAHQGEHNHISQLIVRRITAFVRNI